MNGRKLRWAVVAAALAWAPAAWAQQCDDGSPCTNNDMCSDGMCDGTFQPSASCDDGNECTTNDRCTMDPEFGVICEGEPGTPGTPCQGGCGTCTQLAPIPGIPLTCSGDVADNGKDCDFGINCLEGACQIIGIEGFTTAICIPALKECPDTDGNPCTDSCDFATGECRQDAPKCLPVCETCNAGTGACQPANLGGACDDFNVCSPSSRCETVQGRGLCLPGEATGDTPTPTATSNGATPTSTPPVPATSTVTRTAGTPPTPGACVGDCNDNGVVAVNELITGVNIVLGTAQVSQCPSFDVNGNGEVAINELIGGVNALLNGCA